MPDIPMGHTDGQIRDWIRRSVMVEKRVFVAVGEDQAIVAMMAVSEDHDGGWIDHLYVAPEWVGSGIGTALLQEASRTVRAPIRLYTFQANARARRFYEARGFVAVEFGDGSGNELGLPDVLYRRL